VSVFCAVRAEYLNKLHINYSLWILWLWSRTSYVCTCSADLWFVYWIWIYPKFGFEVSWACVLLLEYCTFDCTAFETSGTSDRTTDRRGSKEMNFQYNAVKTSRLANYEHENSGNVQNVQTQ